MHVSIVVIECMYMMLLLTYNNILIFVVFLEISSVLFNMEYLAFVSR